jgi:transposase
VARLGCYWGIGELGALTLAAEVVDWRRFPAARVFMSYTGLVPAEYSSGEKTRRGHQQKLDGPLQMRSFTGAGSSSPRYSRIRGKRRDKPAWRRRWKSSTSKG